MGKFLSHSFLSFCHYYYYYFFAKKMRTFFFSAVWLRNNFCNRIFKKIIEIWLVKVFMKNIKTFLRFFYFFFNKSHQIGNFKAKICRRQTMQHLLSFFQSMITFPSILSSKLLDVSFSYIRRLHSVLHTEKQTT